MKEMCFCYVIKQIGKTNVPEGSLCNVTLWDGASRVSLTGSVNTNGS